MSGVPVGPTEPITSPSATVTPLSTPIDPRCTRVNEYPSVVRIATVLPPPGTVPAKVTVPPIGATTWDPV
jgi:hypothetical protein